MNAYHVLGGLLALWAVIVSFLGITRENFPASKHTERALAMISVILVFGAVGSAILTALAHEEEEKKKEKEAEKAAFLLPG